MRVSSETDMQIPFEVPIHKPCRASSSSTDQSSGARSIVAPVACFSNSRLWWNQSSPFPSHARNRLPLAVTSHNSYSSPIHGQNHILRASQVRNGVLRTSVLQIVGLPHAVSVQSFSGSVHFVWMTSTNFIVRDLLETGTNPIRHRIHKSWP